MTHVGLLLVNSMQVIAENPNLDAVAILDSGLWWECRLD
jgi:hypothetical protein